VLCESTFEGSGQAGSATVAVSPPSITASIGQSFSIDIDISSVSDLYGWELKLGWNSSLIGLVRVDEGPFLRSGGNTFFSYFLNTTDEHLVVECTLEGHISGVSGNGTLATVTFNTTNNGECPLNLYDVSLIDSSDQSIPCQAVSGYGYFTLAHDVSVTDVAVSPTIVPMGNQVFINATVQDSGGYAETFNVTVYANSQLIGMQPASLSSGASTTLYFTWNTSGNGKGDYDISASASIVLGEVNTGNNIKVASTPVTILTLGHDVAVLNVKPTEIIVGQGYNASVEVTVKNYGLYSETFTVTAYVNTTSVASQNVTLSSGNSTTITFMWNSASFAYGNYTIRAYAWPVPSETDTADNNFTDGIVYVGIPGDLNGDGVVDISDAILLSASFLAQPGDSNWNPNADINNDGIVDISDAIILTGGFI
jgi:hypothetical protein